MKLFYRVFLGLVIVAILAIAAATNAEYQDSSYSTSEGQVALSTTPTLIKVHSVDRRSIIIRNVGASDMYVSSSSTVTSAGSSAGMLVKVGESITLDRSTVSWYGVTSSGTTTAAFLEE